MKKVLSLVVMLGFVAVPLAWCGENEKNAKYIEGTAPGIKKGMEGVTHADGPTDFVFDYKKGEFKIPYLQITGLRYGNKSHMTVRYNPLMGIHPTKVHDYLLTIEYSDENKARQTATFMLGKNRVWATLINLQNKSGQKISYDSPDACKHASKDAPPGQVSCDDAPATPANSK